MPGSTRERQDRRAGPCQAFSSILISDGLLYFSLPTYKICAVRVEKRFATEEYTMPKRKRDESHDASNGVSKSAFDAQQLVRFRATIDQSQKSLVKALKIARGIERQKMMRRQKNASKDPKTLLQRREEVIVMKQLDLDKTAKNHIVKSLLKSKRARESPLFVVVYGSQPKLDPVTIVEGVVLGRLCNSNPVKVVMPKIMANAYDALGIESSKKSAPKTAKGPEVQFKHGPPSSGPDLDPMEITEDEQDNTAELDSDSSSEQSARDGDVLASSEQGSSDDDSESDRVENPGPVRTKRDASSRLVSPPPTTGQTAFLPSLSMGGYYSGSESSDEDDSKSHGAAQPQERKNRRGQRARQQIAEAKYGKSAKHLQNQKNSRDTGWDKRKGAVGASDRGRSKHASFKGTVRDTANAAPQPKPQKRDDTGPIHPSWEAAKQRKLQSTAPATFAGKKITFD